MTRTLVVDCYPDDWKDKVRHYLDLLVEFTEVETIDQRMLGPDSSADEYDAVVITGSPMMLTGERAPVQLARFAQMLSVPTLGICFGHQLLGVASGVKIGAKTLLEDWERVRIRVPGGLFEGMGEEIRVLESHREFLDPGSAVECGWEILADSDSCPVEAMRRPDLPIYGVQFHPERSGDAGRLVVGNFYRNAVAARD